MYTLSVWLGCPKEVPECVCGISFKVDVLHVLFLKITLVCTRNITCFKISYKVSLLETFALPIVCLNLSVLVPKSLFNELEFFLQVIWANDHFRYNSNTLFLKHWIESGSVC